ncbi:MAG: helix-turn-helix domain-containing protein [Alphaproteobacteria bacterium]
MKPRKPKPLPEPTRGERLRAAMGTAGLSQRELARRLGVSRVSVTQYLNGRRQPTLDWLHRAALAGGLDPADLAPGVLASRKEK